MQIWPKVIRLVILSWTSISFAKWRNTIGKTNRICKGICKEWTKSSELKWHKFENKLKLRYLNHLKSVNTYYSSCCRPYLDTHLTFVFIYLHNSKHKPGELQLQKKKFLINDKKDKYNFYRVRWNIFMLAHKYLESFLHFNLKLYSLWAFSEFSCLKRQSTIKFQEYSTLYEICHVLGSKCTSFQGNT